MHTLLMVVIIALIILVVAGVVIGATRLRHDSQLSGREFRQLLTRRDLRLPEHARRKRPGIFPANDGVSIPSRPSLAVPHADPELASVIRQELGETTDGNIVFNPPDEMQQGTPERIEVRISKSIARGLTEGLKGRGVPNTEQIEVGTFMSVRLTGETFEIDSLSHEGQLIPDDDFTQWSWNVRPLKAGVHELSLSVAIRIKLPNSAEELHDAPVLDRRIRVRVNPVYSAVGFLKSNWQWIVTTVVGSGVVWHFFGKSK